MDVKKCTVCNIKIDADNYKMIDMYVRSVTILIEKKYNNNTFSRNDNNKKKGKVVNSVNNTNNSKNRTLIIEFSNCCKTYLMNHILLEKQDPVYIITKSINQYPDIKAQTSDETQPFENSENSTVVFDDMLLSKQESNNCLFFLLEDEIIILICTTYLKVIFTSQKETIRHNSSIIVLLKQTLRDIILLFHDIAGLDMKLEEWKQLCRKAWENDFDFHSNR